MSAEITDLQIVVFSLIDQYFGVDISLVSEIIRLEKITPTPNAPAYVEGIINIRGQIAPAVNLHVLFNTQADERTENNRVIVVETEENKFGLIVDSVSEVRKISPDMIKPVPPSISVDEHYLKGIILDDKNLIVLVDLHQLLPNQDMQHLKQMEQLSET
ncbi:chemotaxis protein CheW [Desulfoscipio gibsoniae]|uniref:Chemotaxis signal transduction protein n=1 Tax=Desulfoscipio gibsoniae DSM 7213 TaxID=767817 RepID=R4KJA8_9FIRM|nr:chemotaxis protein CheW [Desulfoscipio gibsoniae]AGL01707.1 chemotaxis signal transduction protein [Desulfoscipio gibsoniae DSM 7213]